MTKIAYIEKTFKGDRLEIVENAAQIMAQYEADGYSLTLRQLYYQFVARGLIPNAQKEYKRLGEIVNDARLAGLLDWDNIEDRTRGIESLAQWDDEQDALNAIRDQYRIDLWEGQDERPEVWIEKEALAGVVEPICHELRTDYLSCRGYLSQSEQWRAAMRIIRRFRQHKQRTVIFHFGDHDPSGIDMSRDNKERLAMFCRHHLGMIPFRFVRLALNMDQIAEYQPPPNPAKSTDSRFQSYMDKFGDESWELDALEPQVISEMIARNVEGVRDADQWNAMVEREQNERDNITLVTDNFDECVNFARDLG